MGLDYIFTWYQQKIGTYDKQKWETKIEQREQRICGLNHIETRSTTPNTDLIDLDLVRGSSFTKAKPKHGFLKVSRLATLRYVFFPFYGKWWIKQTSTYVFAICLFLYTLQVIDFIVYFSYPTSLSCIEITIPVLMMWVLSWIHSQIVATRLSSDLKKTKLKHRQYRERRSCLKKKQRTQVEKDRQKVEFQDTDTGIVTSSPIEAQEKSELEEVPNASASTDCESEAEAKDIPKPKRKLSLTHRKGQIPQINITSQDSNSEDEPPSSPEIRQSGPLSGELTSSATDWMGGTTNSEDGSYSSEMDNISDSQVEQDKDYSVYDNDLAPTAILNRPYVRVSCTIWERNDIRTADLSMLEISSAIIGKVDSVPQSMDYFYIGIVFSTILAFLPLICKAFNASSESAFMDAQMFFGDIYDNISFGYVSIYGRNYSTVGFYAYLIGNVTIRARDYLHSAIGASFSDFFLSSTLLIQRWILASMVFFLLAVAERTFKQRLLYAKLFSRLTSLRRARKSELPHFRLNKVINIKTWLSVRSYLKKRGPQRSVDVIVSTAFVANLLLLTFLCVEVLKETVIFSQYYLEALIWCLGLGILLLRFMTLGTKLNRKYRNLSVLITEQINLHLQIEQKPWKKEEFNLANNVLKLAIDLLKELENPFKISGISANPILYNVTKLVILSALSGVFSEMLGFKLKLHKIKLK